MTPKERLLSHEQLVTLILEHKYIPQASQQNWKDMLGALVEINPGMNVEAGCSGCLINIAERAKFYIQMIKDELEIMNSTKFMTFPAHTPKVEEVSNPEDFKPIIEKRKPGKKPKQK